MRNKNIYKYYLEDLGHLLEEKVEQHKTQKLNKVMTDYDIGYEMALNELISLMQNQARIFEIDLSEINLAKIDPDKDLLTYNKGGNGVRYH